LVQAVIHVPADLVGEALIGSGAVIVISLVLAFFVRDEWGSPSRTLLQVAGAAAIFFVTLGIQAL